jgi:hypothetical protein
VPNSTVIPRVDAGKLALLQHLDTTLSAYAAALGFGANDLSELDRATAWLKYAIDLQSAFKAGGEDTVAFRNAVRDGSPTGKAVVPSFPILTPPTGEPFLDVVGYVSTLITRIRIHENYTKAIGKALNITPAKSVAVDPATMQPALTVDFQGGQPRVLWSMQGMDSLELEADHGNGDFALLTIDMTPNHIDTTPLPPSGSVVLWKYRAIYRVRDQRVGNWSQVLEVSVKGI